MYNERRNRLAFVFLTPALFVMTLCGVIPMAFVAYYSVHDTFAGNHFFWVGTKWFQQVLTSSSFWGTLLRSAAFSALTLLFQIPLGLYIALRLPLRGFLSSVYIVLIAIPLLTPFIVVGYLWKALTLPNTGLLFEIASWFHINYDMNNTVVVWITLLLMDMWHWTGLVVLLCFAGLRAIPDQYYQAAHIDGASKWAVFRYIQLPKILPVLLIAILLRFMDSFIIYTEPYVLSRGGPGVNTTFLSHELVQTATYQFDLGEAGAISVIYFLIVLMVSSILFRWLVPRKKL